MDAVEDELRAETATYLANQDAKMLLRLARNGGNYFYKTQRPHIRAHFTAFGRCYFTTLQVMVANGSAERAAFFAKAGARTDRTDGKGSAHHRAVQATDHKEGLKEGHEKGTGSPGSVAEAFPNDAFLPTISI